MKQLRAIALISITSTLLNGCAFSSQQADLNPSVSVMNSNEGAGVTVSVRILDERPSKSLGRRGTAYGAAAEITSKQDLAVIVQKEIVDGLKAKGFETEDYEESSDTRLSIEIRLLEYSTSQGFWTGGVRVNAAFKAVATKNGETYERLYRAEDEKRTVVVPGAKSNENMINEALSGILTQILSDQALVNHLAE